MMNCIKIELPESLTGIEIHTLADLHIGDAFSDMKEIRRQIKAIETTPNAYCILNGDLMNNATKTSVSDSYAEKISPSKQIDTVVELLNPIKDKILSIQSGNHEKRTYRKEGIDIMERAAKELGLGDKFSMAGNLVFVRFGWDKVHQRKQCYVIYANHGSGGGRKEGSKAIRLADMAAVVDADIYIHSHTHLGMILKEGFLRVSPSNSCVCNVTKLFVNTASALDYGGYGEEYEYKANSKDTPIIYLDGTRKKADARL
jgi:predicted MPP superfamily phosphohydrolase